MESLEHFVAEKMESKVKGMRDDGSENWVQTIKWYLHHMRARANANPPLLLARAETLAVVLRVFLDEQAVTQHKQGSDFFAQTPMFLAKHCFGFDRFDTAIHSHEAILRSKGEAISKRIDIYREMRQNFSHLADAESSSNKDEDSVGEN